jgi:hypothetical protein
VTAPSSDVVVGRPDIVTGAWHVVGRQNRALCSLEVPLPADSFARLDAIPDRANMCRRCVFVWGWRQLTGQTLAPTVTARQLS